MAGLEMKYFVLKPRGVDIYAVASRIAMREYAKAIAAENPELSNHILEWAYRETMNDIIESRRKEE